MPLVPTLRDELLEHRMRQGRDGCGLVFGKTEHSPFVRTALLARVKRVWKDKELDYMKLHDARHTFASLLIAAGEDPKRIQTYMGHSTITVTFDVYGHLLPGSESESAERLDAFLQRAVPPPWLYHAPGRVDQEVPLADRMTTRFVASRRWLGLTLAATLAYLLCASPVAGAAMYWGGTIKGSVYGLSGEAPTSAAVVSRFEADAGKAITFVNTGQPWAQFDRTTMDAAIATGTIPLVTMGLAEGVTLKDVVGGKQDKEIRAWAKAAREFGYPFLFRPWWEVNGDWYSWGRSPEYIAAWRHFHDLVVEEGATNVTWAWVVNSVWWDPKTESWGPSDPTPYYPGAAYVDWVGMDAYNWGLNPLQPDKWRTPTEVIGPTLEILEGIAPGKPVCICEDASTEKGGEKGPWISSMLGEYLPAHPSIKAYLWFNWNVEQGGQPGTEWDWPIESSPAAQAAFRAGIQSDVYLSSLPPREVCRASRVLSPRFPSALNSNHVVAIAAQISGLSPSFPYYSSPDSRQDAKDRDVNEHFHQQNAGLTSPD